MTTTTITITNEPESKNELETNASKKKRNQAVLGLTARDWVPFPNTPTPTQPCSNTIPDAKGDFFKSFCFFGTSLPPKKGGGVGWGRSSSSKNQQLTQQQQQRARD
jgi:hypothetical protein